MRILITGGLGYLGGRITHYLKGNNYDNLLIGTRRHIEKSGSISGLNFVKTHW